MTRRTDQTAIDAEIAAIEAAAIDADQTEQVPENLPESDAPSSLAALLADVDVSADPIATVKVRGLTQTERAAAAVDSLAYPAYAVSANIHSLARLNSANPALVRQMDTRGVILLDGQTVAIQTANRVVRGREVAVVWLLPNGEFAGVTTQGAAANILKSRGAGFAPTCRNMADKGAFRGMAAATI